jgi:hypothetical protein
MEKELIGIYLSAHPLDDFKLEIEHFCTHSLADLDNLSLLNGQEIEIDSRPSDAIALGVRLGTPIYVSDDVMERAGQVPAEEIDDDQLSEAGPTDDRDDPLDVFRSFVDGLDLDESEQG